MKLVIDTLLRHSERLYDSRAGRWLMGPTASGPCTWRVTCRTRSWAVLCGELRQAVEERYGPADGFVVKARELDAPEVAVGDCVVWDLNVYRGLTGGFLVGGLSTERLPSGEVDLRVGVGPTSRLAYWAGVLTFAAAALLTLAAYFAAAWWLPQAGGGLLLVVIVAAFLLSMFLTGTAARFLLHPLIGAAGRLTGNRLSETELAAAVELVRGVVERSPAVTEVRDGWDKHFSPAARLKPRPYAVSRAIRATLASA